LPTDTINELLNDGRQRKKRLGAMSFFWTLTDVTSSFAKYI